MATFKIIHGFKLRSADKILQPKSIFSTEDEAQLAELRDVYVPHGAAEEVKPQAKEVKAPEAKTVNQEDDITLAKGVGAGLSKKLAEKGLTTLSGLKAAMTDKAREEEMKELLGAAYAKVLANFVEPQKDDSPAR